MRSLDRSRSNATNTFDRPLIQSLGLLGGLEIDEKVELLKALARLHANSTHRDSGTNVLTPACSSCTIVLEPDDCKTG